MTGPDKSTASVFLQHGLPVQDFPSRVPLGARVQPADSELPHRRIMELADANVHAWHAAMRADAAMKALTDALVRLHKCADPAADEYIMVPAETGPHLSVRDMADNVEAMAAEVAAIYAALDDSTARVMR